MRSRCGSTGFVEASAQTQQTTEVVVHLGVVGLELEAALVGLRCGGGPTLVLTTRRYPQHAPVFMRAGRVYVQPSRKVAASSWDYTSPDAYEQTWRQGREDGEAFLRGFPSLRSDVSSLGGEAAGLA